MDLADADLVARTLAGELAAFGTLMQRSNRLVHRVVWCILRDAPDTDDVMQQAYVSAYVHLTQFAGRSTFAAWVTQIALREAIACRARRHETGEHGMFDVEDRSLDPERATASREVGRAIANALAALPEHYRLVFVLREIEGLSTADTAAALSISDEAVKVRLHRARSLLGDDLTERLGVARDDLLVIGGARCAHVVDRTLACLIDGSS